jgi:phosphoribosylaminoimidazole-succinocarboxamide synthase
MSYPLKKIIENIPYALSETNIVSAENMDCTKLHRGKVRDTYSINDTRALITSDRQSAFDRNIASVPFKGQVLNRIAKFWFDKTAHILPNHVISVPDSNVLLAKTATVFPIEFVVRGYITGSTSTSSWVNYQKGVREFCGHTFPEGLKKNQKLQKNIVTPTTKPETGHDENVSREEIIERGLMSAEDFDFVAKKALEIFELGQEHCAKNGLILVDTKYEFGKTSDGEIIILDEVHTPDSSRFWDAESYDALFAEGKEPKSFDKDVLRRWYSDQCDPYAEGDLPEAPDELIAQLSYAYMEAYEKITGEEFIPEVSKDPNARIQEKLQAYFTG